MNKYKLKTILMLLLSFAVPAIWAQSDAPLERTEVATAPCLLFSTCLTQLQQINHPGPPQKLR
jgi:hypothetical protein